MKIVSKSLILILIAAAVIMAGCAKSNQTQKEPVSQNSATPTPEQLKAAQEWLKKGLDSYKAKKYDKAIAAYDEAIKADPLYSTAMAFKGDALAQLGKYDEAMIEYDRAIKNDPKNADGWFGKGFILSRQKKYADAIAAYSEGFKFSQENPVSYYGRAICYAQTGYKKEALDDLKKAFELFKGADFIKTKARKDENFKSIWDDEEFKKITGSSK